MVVAGTYTGVDADEDLTIAEEVSPLRQHIRVVDGYLHPALECPRILLAGSKIRRVEDTSRIEVREKCQDALRFLARHALELEPLGAHSREQRRMRVGLHCVVHALHGAHVTQRPCRRAHGIEVVDVSRLAVTQRLENPCAFLPPPWRRPHCRQLRLREEVLPGRSEHPIARHRPDQELMELIDQPVSLTLIDDEGEVEIVGRLAHQIDLLLLEELEGAAQLMQYRADVAPDETHRGARAYHLHSAEPGEIAHQTLH